MTLRQSYLRASDEASEFVRAPPHRRGLIVST